MRERGRLAGTGKEGRRGKERHIRTTPSTPRYALGDKLAITCPKADYLSSRGARRRSEHGTVHAHRHAARHHRVCPGLFTRGGGPSGIIAARASLSAALSAESAGESCKVGLQLACRCARAHAEYYNYYQSCRGALSATLFLHAATLRTLRRVACIWSNCTGVLLLGKHCSPVAARQRVVYMSPRHRHGHYRRRGV